jgi:hypothetical protein
MATPTAKTTKTAGAKAPQLFNIRTVKKSTGSIDRELAGTLKDYLVDSEELSLSENVEYPVMNVKTDQAVTLKIVYDDNEDNDGLLWFSRPLSAKLRNKAIKLADMLDYPIQKQPIFMDMDNEEPLIDEETGLQVTKYVISKPEGGGRINVKKPIAGQASNKPKVTDMW